MGRSTDLHVVLLRPKFQGNIGSIARAMANFGLSRLTLVDSQDLEDDAYRYSKHARHVLEGAGRANSLKEVLKGADLSVATSGICNANEKKRERNPITPRELAVKLEDYEGEVVLVFGPEDDGLGMEDIVACDLVVTIPTDAGYPIMNLSHSVSIILYELRGGITGLPVRARSADASEKELLFDKFDELLVAVNYPEHKRGKTSTLFRRVMGRATPSKWEFHTLMGVMNRAVRRVEPHGGEGSIGTDDGGQGDGKGDAVRKKGVGSL